MPELPEVETVRQILRKNLIGLKIVDVIIRYEKIIKKSTKEEFRMKLLNQTIKEVYRQGKYLYFEIGDFYLLSHLRMEGKFNIKPHDEDYTKHEHIIFSLDNKMDLRFDDVRKFGTMELKTKEELHSTYPLNSLGVDALDENLKLDDIIPRFNTKKTLKGVLLDQNFLSGIGNIYANEICFRSHLHPSSIASHLSKDDIKLIFTQTKEVLKEAVLAGGTTIRSYTSSLGVTGHFQQNLFVHGKKGEHCRVCGQAITKIVVAGRGTYLCEKCQKLK